MFYDRYKHLCEKNSLKPTTAAKKMGFSNSIVTKWKKGSVPNTDTLTVIANYFGVTTDYLSGNETAPTPANKDEREITDRQIKAAFFRGANMTEEEMDAAWEDVLDMRELILKRRAREKGEK